MKQRYRAVAVGKGLLLGGVKTHASSWFKTKKEALDWVYAIRTGNESAGRKIDHVTLERKGSGKGYGGSHVVIAFDILKNVKV
jgi:hypothetical protein